MVQSLKLNNLTDHFDGCMASAWPELERKHKNKLAISLKNKSSRTRELGLQIKYFLKLLHKHFLFKMCARTGILESLT